MEHACPHPQLEREQCPPSLLPFTHIHVWGQANNNGTNLLLQNLLESIASTMRGMDRSTAPMSYHIHIIFLTYKKYVVTEHNTFLEPLEPMLQSIPISSLAYFPSILHVQTGPELSKLLVKEH
jgi:hypothetical protein